MIRYEIRTLCRVHGMSVHTCSAVPRSAPRCRAEDAHRPDGVCGAYMSVLGTRELPDDRRLITVEGA